MSGVEYMKVRIEDHPYARIQDYFDQVADKIKAVKDRGGKTLVHCMAGVSRSASLVMIYLVKYEHMTLRQAYHYVRSSRPVIRPNVGVASITMVMTNQCDLPIPDIYVDDLKRAQEREQLQQKTTAISSSLIRPPLPALSVTKRRGYSASQTDTSSLELIFSNLRPITSTLRRSTSPAVTSSGMQYSVLSPAPSRKPRDSLFSLYSSTSRPFFSAF
ncbi:unnamed protein product [Heligmosomoides polygyrus]|uniref:Protein-tyrosine-phosphatase n=1 Tax=Heligmosomoides polygyrus TaxID=6339 RepID=A0A183GPJ7_HELPZ|nr:unnamed protein product [Heligmosomoides polygyrus]